MMSAMTRHLERHWVTGLVALIALLLVACGAAGKPAEAPKAKEPAPAKGVAAQPVATPALRPTNTPVPAVAPRPVATPAKVAVTKDKLVFVTNDEPLGLDSWTNRCTFSLTATSCTDIVQEPLTWIESKDFRVVPFSGVERWQQVDPKRWRFTLRKGVKFHNGEPWNAAAAKAGLDVMGDPSNGLDSYSFHGAITAEVVDEFTVDVVCKDACPVLPRGTIFTRFQAPQWYKSASEQERNRMTISIGPYKILEWRPGVQITMELYKDYVPNQAVDAQAPVIRNITQFWRGEGLVRAAMVKAGEADWAMDIGFENRQQVPAFKIAGTTEVFALVADTMWHPELKKTKVRQALMHAFDCQALTKALYEGLVECMANISVKGTVGITDRNFAPYKYDPELARRLLKEAGYDPANRINMYTLANRVVRDVEWMEAVANYWNEVGINAKVVLVEQSVHATIRSSGCGRFNKEAGYTQALDCSQRKPPQPHFDTSHLFSTGTSNEMLDLQVQLQRRSTCFNISSRVCYPELQKKIDIAVATPGGPERTRLMEEIGDIIHDEAYFISFFPVKLVYGLAKDLVWEPPYAPRLRVNTMRFTK